MVVGPRKRRPRTKAVSDIDRFWSKVDRRGPTECWPWLGQMEKLYGYGRFSLLGRKLTAQRCAVLFSGRGIPPKREVDHICRNPSCVNPAHLRIVTKAVNLATRAMPRATACKNGHPFTDASVVLQANGRGRIARRCRACTKLRKAAYLRRKNEQ